MIPDWCYSLNVSVIARHNQGSGLITKSILFPFPFKNSPTRLGQGQVNILICSLSTNNPSILQVPPIMSSLSWCSVTSDPCWNRESSLSGCLQRWTAGWLTHSDHGGLKRGWSLNRLAASGSLSTWQAGWKDRREADRCRRSTVTPISACP